MSTQNILNRDESTAQEALEEYLKVSSMNVLKKIRFSVGKIDHHSLRHLLKINKIFNRRNVLTKDQNEKVIEEILTQTISNTDGLQR